MESTADRLKFARNEAGFKRAVDAANAMGVSYPTYAAHENGSRGITPEMLSKYAAKYRVTVDWLLNGKSAHKKAAETVTPVRLISWVSAGGLTQPDITPEIFDDFPTAYAPDLDPAGDWIALRVDGHSMDRISPHDSIIFVNRKEKTLVPNALYIIGDGNGGATYKRYRPPNILEAVTTRPDQYPPITFDSEPDIIGRVRKTILSL